MLYQKQPVTLNSIGSKVTPLPVLYTNNVPTTSLPPSWATRMFPLAHNRSLHLSFFFTFLRKVEDKDITRYLNTRDANVWIFSPTMLLFCAFRLGETVRIFY